MVDSSNKKRKEFISEEDIATLLQRYDTMTILKLLQEMAYYADPKMDWNELVKKTSTGITDAREYQLLWRHLAYRDSLLPIDQSALLLDDDSDMECELETSPAVSVDAVAEAVAHVKVIAASFVPSESDIPEDSTFEAPLTINIPYGLHRGPQEPSDSYWSSRGMNITFPISLQKAAEGHNGNGLASSVAPRKRRKKWLAEEDEELIAAVKRHGEGSWALIAKEEFEGERTASQLSQRWGAIRRRCDTSNSFTQSGQQRTEAQMAANRALSLAVGNRVPSKKPAVGIPPMLTSGSITGAQAKDANGGNSLQCQQVSQPVVQALPWAATSAPTAKSRVPAKKTIANFTSRAELMVTANSVAAAACMSGLATAVSVPKVEPGKKAVSALVPNAQPVINASPASTSLPCPSAISTALNAEPVKNASPSAATFPRPSGISAAPNAQPVKAASAATSPRPSGISAAPNAQPVKAASAPSFPRPSSISAAPNAQPVKAGSAASFPRPSGISAAPNGQPVKAGSAASFPRPSGISAAPNGQPVKAGSAASFPRPSGISAAPNGQPVKAGSAASIPRPSGILAAPNAQPVKAASAASLPRPSDISSASKAEPVKTASEVFVPRPSGIISTPKAEPVKTASAVSLSRPSGIVSAQKAEPVKAASAVSLPRPSSIQSASKAEPVKSVTTAGPMNVGNAVIGSPRRVISSSPFNMPSPMAPFSKGPTIQNNSVPSGFASSRLAPTQRVPAATVIPQKPNAGAAVTATCKPVGVQKEHTQGLQPNKTISTNSVISTGKPVAAKVETPSLLTKNNQVPQTERKNSTTVSPLVVAEAESKPKDVATVTGTEQKGL